MVKKTALLWLALAFCLVLCGCCNHSFEQVEYRKSTCWEKGIDSKRCTKCNEMRTVYSERLAHVYKRTETENGPGLFTCVLCGYSYTEEDATAPAETETTKVPEATEAQTAGEWVTVGADHSYKLRETKEATCAAEGYNTWSCNHCGDVKYQALAALPHSYGEAQRVEPGCNRAGKRLFTCNRCGHSYEEPVESLGHDYSLAQVLKTATCTTAGMQSLTCARCADSCLKEIAALGHEETAPTCEESARCNRCAAVLAPPLGHALENGSCGRCGKILDTPQPNQQLEAERQRHSLAVEAINRETEAQCRVNEETVALLMQRYDIGQLLSREEYEERETVLVAQIRSTEERFYGTRDLAEQQALQRQLDTLNSERKTLLVCLYAVELLEENQALEELRRQRLAEEDRIHEENIKEIKKQYS